MGKALQHSAWTHTYTHSGTQTHACIGTVAANKHPHIPVDKIGTPPSVSRHRGKNTSADTKQVRSLFMVQKGKVGANR